MGMESYLVDEASSFCGHVYLLELYSRTHYLKKFFKWGMVLF